MGHDTIFMRPADASTHPDPQRLQTFIEALARRKSGWIPLDELWILFADAFPHRPHSAEYQYWFVAALRTAAEQAVIRLPSSTGTCWDHTLRPPVPRFVTRVAVPKPPRNKWWQHFPWHEHLLWVTKIVHLSSEQEQFLRRVHEGLVKGMFHERAPIKYRSLQLTGHEKRLEQLMQTRLFSEGRLTLDLLGCVPDIPPLALEQLNNKPTAIVFENVGAFRVAKAVLPTLQDQPYGIVAFGSGLGFQRSVLHFTLVTPRIERIEYLGDLDWTGVSIPYIADQIARREGLPAILPATGMHEAMLKAAQGFDHLDGFPNDVDDAHKVDDAVVTWLPEGIRADVLRILHMGRRVPEEVLGPEEMRAVWDGGTPKEM